MDDPFVWRSCEATLVACVGFEEEKATELVKKVIDNRLPSPDIVEDEEKKKEVKRKWKAHDRLMKNANLVKYHR